MNLIHNLTAWDQVEREKYKLSIDTEKIIAITEENFTIIDDFLSEKTCYGSGILTGTGQYYFVMKPYHELIEIINNKEEKPPEMGVLAIKFVDSKFDFKAIAYVKNIEFGNNPHIDFTSDKYKAMTVTEEEAKHEKFRNFTWVKL
ncbi:hypothetical protein ACRCOO_00775 [Streptococcus uberis]|uniref:hypothetical protein n=1 Tax=Streptococcus uberis TaxID=1349 RepID=UPI003D6AEC1A